jgi:hypothetical protein
MLWAGVAGPVVFTVVWLIEGAVRPGYDPWRDWVSELALSGRGWIQVASFLVSGGLIVVFGRALRVTLADGPGATWGPRLVTLAGAALFGGGVFTIDPGFCRPAGMAEEVTWHGQLHEMAAAIAVASLVATAFVFSRRFARTYGRTTGILTIVFGFASGALNGLDHADIWSPAPAGLLQRLSLLTPMAYLAYLAHRTRADTAPPLHLTSAASLGLEGGWGRGQPWTTTTARESSSWIRATWGSC